MAREVIVSNGTVAQDARDVIVLNKKEARDAIVLNKKEARDAIVLNKKARDAIVVLRISSLKVSHL